MLSPRFRSGGVNASSPDRRERSQPPVFPKGLGAFVLRQFEILAFRIFRDRRNTSGGRPPAVGERIQV